MNHSVCQFKLGLLNEAIASADESERISTRLGNRRIMLHLNLIRAKAMLLLGRHNDARVEIEVVLDHIRAKSQSREESIGLEVLGDAALAGGDFHSAREFNTRAMRLARRIGARCDLICGDYRRLGEIELAEGAIGEAIEAGEKAIEYAAGPGEYYEEGAACHLLARCYEGRREWDRAYVNCRRGIAILREHGAALALAELQVTAARIRLKWWAESRRQGMSCGLMTADSEPLTRDECDLPKPPGVDEVYQSAHLEASWSYVVEAYHAFSKLNFESGRARCAELMEDLRRDAEPPWRSSSTPKLVVGVGGRGDDKNNIDPAGFVACAATMVPVMRLVETATTADDAVLITGETGTGKELIARMVHAGSHRADAEFVAVNCAAVPASIFEREFFGHSRGAYTGASATRPGVCQRAEGGTLFLDEIGEMSLPLQAKLLRLIQEGTYRRLGDPRERRANLRILTATNVDLGERMEAGRFRADLYYRLQVLEVALPPLRHRREDFGPLLELFTRRATEGHLGMTDLLKSEAIAVLRHHSWPGNVRELGNLVRRLVLLVDPGRPLGLAALPVEIVRPALAVADLQAGRMDLGSFLAEAEKAKIRQALVLTRGNRTEAARLLGISRNTLYTKMKKSGLRMPVGRGVRV